MKILVYGAGVIGSVYAARLQVAGCDVSILARGQRLNDLRDYGLMLDNALTGERTSTPVNLVEHLSPEDAYDLIVVAMRKHQVPAILPILAANQRTPNVLFMVNNSSGYDEWLEAIAGDPGTAQVSQRLLVGFPSASGSLDGHIVRYMLGSRRIQPTMLGEPDGRITPRLKTIAKVFKQAGFPVALSRNMDAWQKTHIAVISPIANAFYMAGGNGDRLAQTPEVSHLMVHAMREGFQVLRAIGTPITPAKFRMWQWMPDALLVALLKRWITTPHFDIAVAHHANNARDEMQRLTLDFQNLARQTAVATPAIDQLETYIDLLQPGGLKVAHP